MCGWSKYRALHCQAAQVTDGVWVWQMRREQNLHREFAVKDVQVLQSLQQQLRMYVAKLRTILEALRKARSHLCA